jgi:hypothetical protein
MSLEEIEKAVMRLTPNEQIRFARWVYEHEVELKGGDEYISPQVQAKIRERAEVARTSPELLEGWDTASAKLRQHRDEQRRKNARAKTPLVLDQHPGSASGSSLA